MSLSRSPSPHPGGGWTSPGLSHGSRSSTPRSHILPPRAPGATGPSGISWAVAKAKSERVKGYPSFSTRNNGFFSRQKRMISSSLPGFRSAGYADNKDDDDYVLGRGGGGGGGGKWSGRGNGRGGMRTCLGSLVRRRRLRLLLVVIMVWVGYFFFGTGIAQAYRRSPFGGGRKFVVVLGSNVEGGVMEWKGAAEWAVERNSIWDKQRYAERWGYELEIVNMLAKKRYSHEWREGWEKIDAIRDAMQKYPDAEWFWWLDLNTWIMEHSYSLQDHMFKNLKSHIYRDINEYNPLNISHPPTEPYLDFDSRSANADQDPSSINIILSQDCSGFNLGSFFVRNSVWTDRLLDAWWDPVMYEQMHMAWEHNEQDSLEYLYESQPWLRSGTAFVPQRHINAFPPEACEDDVNGGINPQFHYLEESRNFLVNMAGCQFGRDCWGEMFRYRELSMKLGRSWWQRLKDGVSKAWENVSGQDSQYVV